MPLVVHAGSGPFPCPEAPPAWQTPSRTGTVLPIPGLTHTRAVSRDPKRNNHAATQKDPRLNTTITLYTKPNCVQCDATKRRFAQLGIPHTEIDVTEDAEALAHIKTLGYLQAPVVELPNGRSWSGFRPDLIKNLKEDM